MPMPLAHDLGAINFEDNDRSHGIEDWPTEDQLPSPVLLFYFHRAIVGELVGSLDPVLHSRQFKWHAGLLEECDVQLSRFSGDAPLVVRQHKRLSAQILVPSCARFAHLLAPGSRSGTVDGVAVELEPPADSTQVILYRLRNDSVGHGADVQQVVAALACNVDKLECDLAG